MIEVLVVLTISAILVAISVPMMTSTIRSSRISSTSNELLASIDLARSDSIRRNVPVSICRSLVPEAPAPVCSSAAGNGYAANDWASGWFSFAKAPGNVDLDVLEAGDEILYRRGPPAAPGAERLIVETTFPAAQRLSYGPNGLRAGGNPGTFFIDHRDVQLAVRSNAARCIAVNFPGSPRTARVVNDACPPA